VMCTYGYRYILLVLVLGLDTGYARYVVVSEGCKAK